MIFESLYIADFGKLSEMHLRFSDGVNIIEGANESGKSTICAFLQFIFYGLAGRADEKLRYISWKTSRAAGTLTFFEGEQHYRVEREVICVTGPDGKNNFRERCAIFDADTNQIVFKGQSPGDVFFGVSSLVFESTAYIRQAGESKVGGSELGEEAENILFSGNESINAKKALDKLDEARVFLMHKSRRGGKIADLETERDTVSAQLETAKEASENIIYLEGTQRQLSEKKANAEENLAAVDAELEQYERWTLKKAYLRRKAEKARLAETEERLAAVKNPTERGGADVTAESYITWLESKQRELELAESKRADAQEELDNATQKLDSMSEKIEIFERFGARSGAKTRAALIERAHASKKRIRSANRLAVLFFLLFALSLGAGIYALTQYSLESLSCIIPLCVVPVALALGVIFLCRKREPKRVIADICKRFSCKNYSEFEELVRAASEDEAYMLYITTAREEAEDHFSEASDRLDMVSAEILKALNRDGFPVSDRTSTTLANAIAECRKAQTEIAKLEAAREEQMHRIAEIEESLSAYPKDYLREACTADYDEDAMAAFNLQAKKREHEFHAGAIASLTDRLHKIEVELSALLATSVHPTELAEEKASLDAQIASLTDKWNAYMLAIESLESASGKLREGLSPKIAKSASKLMGALTDGKYDTVGVDRDFGLSFSADGMTHDVSSLSAGTGDLAYICLRIALIELMYQKAMPPFLFDESFVRMDNGRLAKMLSLISKYAERHIQSILFTCHHREQKLMENLGECHVLSI